MDMLYGVIKVDVQVYEKLCISISRKATCILITVAKIPQYHCTLSEANIRMKLTIGDSCPMG